MSPDERRNWIERTTGKPVCDEEHPFLCEDEEGEISLRCGLPAGHEPEKHEDARQIVHSLGGAP